jgi:hypothetical protein
VHTQEYFGLVGKLTDKFNVVESRLSEAYRSGQAELIPAPGTVPHEEINTETKDTEHSNSTIRPGTN